MASTSTRVALIFGAGSNIGTALVKGFLGAGYRVATVSRSKPEAPDAGTYPIQADVSDPKAVPGVFAKVAAAGLEFPSVVMCVLRLLLPPPPTPVFPFVLLGGMIIHVHICKHTHAIDQ